MSYITDFERQLAAKIDGGAESTAEIVRWAAERVLESYRNGVSAGQNGEQVVRKGESRRRGTFGRAA